MTAPSQRRCDAGRHRRSTWRGLLFGTLAAIVAVAASACSTEPTEPAGLAAQGTTAPDSPNITQAPAVAWPQGRRGHALVSIGAGELLVVGGQGSAGGSAVYLGDVWSYDSQAAAWQPATEGPASRAQHAAAYDSTTETAFLFGGWAGGEFAFGDTWLRPAGGVWEQIEGQGPSPRAGAAAAYDAESGLVVLFGGAERPPLVELPLAETWVFDVAARTWAERTPEVFPELAARADPAIFNLAMAYDAQSDRIILVIGGGQTWAYDTNNNSWERRSDQGLRADSLIAAAYDEQHDRLVAYGGAPTSRTQETWLYHYESDSWEEVPTSTDPGRVGDHAMAFDPIAGLVYLLGGSNDPSAPNGSAVDRGALWTFDGETWSRVGP